MPIRFRCDYCNRLLGIARRKAGSETTCPHCGYAIIVPEASDQADDKPEENTDSGSAAHDAANFDEIDAMLGKAQPSSEPVQAAPAPSAPQQEKPRPNTPIPAAVAKPNAPAPRAAPVVPRPVPQHAPAPAPKATPPGERPLFERDLDAVLGGTSSKNAAEAAKPKPKPTSGMDAMSLEPDSGHIVLSTQKATVLAVGVVLIVALAFAAGFLIGSR